MTVGDVMYREVIRNSVMKIAKELERANRLKAIEIYLSTNGKMDHETRKSVEEKIKEIMK